MSAQLRLCRVCQANRATKLKNEGVLCTECTDGRQTDEQYQSSVRAGLIPGGTIDPASFQAQLAASQAAIGELLALRDDDVLLAGIVRSLVRGVDFDGMAGPACVRLGPTSLLIDGWVNLSPEQVAAVHRITGGNLHVGG